MNDIASIIYGFPKALVAVAISVVVLLALALVIELESRRK